MNVEELRIVDFHCDALSKMQEMPDIVFRCDPRLDVTKDRMSEGGVALQIFAIYLSTKRGRARFEDVLGQIDIFRRNVVGSGGLQWLRWKEEVPFVSKDTSGWGMLSLEGVDGLEGNLYYAQLCFELGVRIMGVTWNYANWAADGVLEHRNGGFTHKGRQFVEWCNSSGMLLDVSHLSVTGFWELSELITRPFIASHSNASAMCSHPRNLNDEQIKALVAMDGRVGLTFFPWFVCNNGAATSKDLLKHIDHICSLGGGKHIMFGSDFDGIDSWVKGLEHSGKYSAFAELLLRYYSEDMVKGWLHNNAVNYLKVHLPSNSH